MVYEFNNIELDSKKFCLFVDGKEIAVEPQVFNVIIYLVEHRDNIVSRDELLANIWKGKIVSDTSITNHIKSARKALGDDGVKQQVIKTIHSRGYQFIAEITDNPNTIEVTKSTFKPKKFRSNLIVLSVILLLIFFAIKYYQKVELHQSVQKIANYQEISYATFIAQTKRRNELVDMIESRIGEKREMQFERYFSYYFKKLNDQEQFVFDQIRAMTDIGLYQNNLNIVTELNNHPKLFSLIPGTKELHNHLTFWLNKYHSVFKKRPDMCLLYVGVEDGLPYPSEVNKNVKDWLENTPIDEHKLLPKEKLNISSSSDIEFHTESNSIKEPSSLSNQPLLQHPQLDNQSLIAYYPFNGNTVDESGNNNHGILSNVTLTTNRFGKNSAYEFNGKDSVITISNSPSLMSPKNEFSVVVWVNAYGWSKVGSGYSPIITKSDTRENNFQYRLLVSDYGMTIAISNSHNRVTFPVDLVFNQWHMLAVTIKYGVVKGYYDGVYIGEEEILGPLYQDNKPLKIGHDVTGVLAVFNGKIDDVRLYNQALNSVEVEKLFNLSDLSL